MARRRKHQKPLPQSALIQPVEGSKSAARAKSGYRPWVLFAAVGLVAGAIPAASIYSSFKPPASATVIAPPSPAATAQSAFKQPATLAELLAVPVADLGKVDLARMNLLCAEGLPGCEDMDIPRCLATLDRWTAKVKENIDRHYDEFIHDPMESHTLAEYKMMVIQAVLGPKGYGVHYDHDLAVAEYGADPATDKSLNALPSNDFGPDFFAQSDLFFLNGLLGPKRDGTCSSLPVLVAAVAQRLGYPVKLVNTFRHTFVRWDDGKERFNIETTVVGGLQVVSDYDYRQWPRPLNAMMIATEGYLQPLTPAQTLACFLYSRVGALMANGRMEEAVKLRPKCSELVPASVKYSKMPSM